MMGPSKRSRIVKRHPKFSKEWAYEDKKSTVKSKVKKRKLSEMLGSQWSKEEVESFYEAYCKYGSNWKKVAAKVRNRSSDEVEALYNMSRAYLSLPEGTATAAGLVAMVSDHYNILDGNVGVRDNNQVTSIVEKPQKHCRGKNQDTPKDQSNPSTSDCLSLLRRSGSGGFFGVNRARAVGKRTPRYPVPSLLQNNLVDSSIIPLDEQKSKSADENIHVAALTLAEASLETGLPQISRALDGRLIRASDFSSMVDKREHGKQQIDNAYFASGVNKDSTEDSLGSIQVGPGVTCKDDELQENGANGIEKKLLKFQRKRVKGSGISIRHHDDTRKNCCGIEEINTKDKEQKDEVETNEGQYILASENSSEKPLNICSADEKSALDALQALAELSPQTLLPQSSAPSEPGSNKLIRHEFSHMNERDIFSESGAYLVFQKTSQLRGNSSSEKCISEPKSKRHFATIKKQKRKRNSQEEKISNENAKRPSGSELGALSINEKAVHEPDLSSESSEEGIIGSSQLKPTRTGSLCISSTGTRTRRKIKLRQEMAGRDWKPSERVGDESCSSLSDFGTLSHCLSSKLLRKWCIFEWFYSSIDFPWFARVDFIDYLNHVRLGHIPRLTRVEWSIIRSSLGKPRRLSSQFLREEMRKLEQYRESVRSQYAELQTGSSEGFPRDLARPFSVGQRVIVIHPKTRELHDGSILYVDQSRYRVQFDKCELGIEFVKDIDCMVMCHWENMPEDLKQYLMLYKNCVGGSTLTLSFGNSEMASSLASSIFPLVIHKEHIKMDASDANRLSDDDYKRTAMTSKHSSYSYPCYNSNHTKEADVGALAKLTHALEKKEALLMELRCLNEDGSRKQNSGNAVGNSEQFRKHYAMILLHLQEANNQVSSALLDLRQCSTSDVRSISKFSGFLEPCRGLYPSTAAEPHMLNIVDNLRREANDMVNSAIEATISHEVREGFLCKATESMVSKLTGTSSMVPEGSNVDYTGSSLTSEDVVKIEFSDPTADDLSSPNFKLHSDVHAVQMPSELVSACVAALLMIQACADQQYPPAEVAGILECAVTDLQPRCSENLPIYHDIEACMGLIKTQMLALIPTQSPSPA